MVRAIKRTHLLIMASGAIFVLMVALRVFSEFNRADPSLAGQVKQPAHLVSIPVPRDYVARPVVTEGEQNRGPARIISMAPSITEIVCALGMRNRLVGRTQFCTHPPGLESVPEVGALMDTNYPLIKSLQPDLVLTTDSSRPVIDNLQALELSYKAVPHGSVDDVYEAIALIGKVSKRPRTARALTDAIRADIKSLRTSAAGLNIPSRRLLVVAGPLPVTPKAIFVAGPGSFLDELTKMAGHTNLAGEALKSPWGEIPMEILCFLDPEVIVDFRDHPDKQQMEDLYRSWLKVGELQAIRHYRVRSLGGREWLSAGPRIAIELHQFITLMSEFR